MRRLLISFCLLLPSLTFAAVQTTTVQGKILMPSGGVATGGTITAQLSSAGTSDDLSTGASQRIGGRVIGTIDASGNVTGLVLVPNDAILPSGTYYTVSISTTGPIRTSWTEKWSVTTTPDPVDVGDITVLDVIPSLTSVLNNLADVTISSPTSGQCIILDTDGVWKNSSSCGGGTPAFNTITSGTNTTAAMVVGGGASIAATGGTVEATEMETGTLAACNSTPGRIRVQSSAAGVAAPVRVCDNQANDTLRYLADGNSTGVALSAVSAGSAATATEADAANAITFDPTACSAGQYVSDMDAAFVLTCSTPGAGTYLPLDGSQPMTGTITGRNDGTVLVVPPSTLTAIRDIEFQSQGNINSNPSWHVSVDQPASGAGSDNHVFTVGYNYLGGSRTNASLPWWRMLYESSPSVGTLEWALTVDPNNGPAGPVGIFKNIWFYYYDTIRQATSLNIGMLPADGDSGTAGWQAADPNDFFFAMNRAGGTGFVLGGRSGTTTSSKTTFMDMTLALAGDPNNADPYDPNSLARIVIDPGGEFSASDRGMFISNLSGHLDFESGLQSVAVGGARQKMYFGYHRPTDIIIGTNQAGSSRFTLDGYQDQIQMTVQAHSTQTSDIFVVETSAGTDRFAIGNTGGITGAVAPTGSATINFGSIGPTACADVDDVPAAATVTVTGAVDGDPCVLGVAAGIYVTGSSFTCHVTAADTVTVRHCCSNGVAGTCNPNSGVFRVRVLK